METIKKITFGDQYIKRFVKLAHKYTFEWKKYEVEQGTHCFMLQLVNPVK